MIFECGLLTNNVKYFFTNFFQFTNTKEKKCLASVFSVKARSQADANMISHFSFLYK